jgi:hypothetical protein
MDKRLSLLIDDYLASVSSAVELLELSGVTRPASNTEWACNGVAHTGVLSGGVEYFKHGYGCMVRLKSGPVDFDFGEKGEINGFDVWRLAGFAEGKLGQYGFTAKTELETLFKAEVAAGEIIYSGYINHYLRETGA